MSYKSTSLHLYVSKTAEAASAFKVSSNATDTTTTLDALNSYKLQLKSNSDVVLSTSSSIILEKGTTTSIDLIDQIEKQNELIKRYHDQIIELQTVINNIADNVGFNDYTGLDETPTSDLLNALHPSSS
jgi:hypothetical protein